MSEDRPSDEAVQRFEIQAPPEWFERIDRWRGKQNPVPSRDEAIRSFVTAVLELMKE